MSPGVETATASQLFAFKSAWLRRGLVLADSIAIAIGLAVALALQYFVRPLPPPERLDHVLLTVATGPLWLVAMAANKLYVSRAIERPREELRRILLAGGFTIGILLSFVFAIQYTELSRFHVASLFSIVTTMLLIERRLARWGFRSLRSHGLINRRVAVIGTDSHAIGLLHTIQRNPALGYEVVGFIGDNDLGQRGGKTVLGGLDRAADVLTDHNCVGAFISLPSVETYRVNQLTRKLTDSGFHVALSTGLRDIDVTRMRPQALDGQTLVYIESTIRTGWRRVAKRAFDLVVSSVALLLTAPVLAVAAVLIKMDSPGPVLFRQERAGKDGEVFRMIKFRTMSADAEAQRAALLDQNESDGPLFKIAADPRITRVGRVLRKLSIDELPQFWNVIRGEMSVVGPRPALPSEVEMWDVDLHDRLRVLPGITGMWQVSGRSETTFEEYRRLDLYYVDNWSLLHDVRIVFKTFGAVLRSRGAS